MASARLLYKNCAPCLLRRFSSSAYLNQKSWTLFPDEPNLGESSAVYKRALRYQRPSSLQYNQDIFHNNSVSLIGTIENQLQKINTANGRFGFYTRLKICSRSDRFFWLTLKFWEEMAEMAVEHVKQGDCVYVSGPLGSYVMPDIHGKDALLYQVNVKEINFVAQHVLGPVSQNSKRHVSEVSGGDVAEKRKNRLHLWQVFFRNPDEWWDNRGNKSHPKIPDFKHKDTSEALWLSDSDPPWIKQQLNLYDSKLRDWSQQEKTSSSSHLSSLIYQDS